MPTLEHEFRHIEYIEKKKKGIYSGKERREQSSEGHVLKKCTQRSALHRQHRRATYNTASPILASASTNLFATFWEALITANEFLKYKLVYQLEMGYITIKKSYCIYLFCNELIDKRQYQKLGKILTDMKTKIVNTQDLKQKNKKNIWTPKT